MRRRAVAALAAGMTLAAAACSPTGLSDSSQKTIIVTYSVLGAVVRDLVGNAANVVVLMPNGADPHDWDPSAKDIATVTKADLLVENGLDLEGGMGNAFALAEQAGVKRFVAADHITVRNVGAGEGVDASADQATGAPDPHLWMDPLTIRQVVDALAPELKTDFGIDVSSRRADLDARLGALNDGVASILAVIPAGHRKLVTGHESLGYFAQRYGLTLIGAIIPSLSTSSEASAADLATLAGKIRAAGVPAIFTELGTSPAVADAIGQETGARVVQLTTHALPPDGTYATFITTIATLIADNLR